jgi:hypothetical protein
MPWIGQTDTLGGRGAPPLRRRRPDANRTRDESSEPGAILDPSWGPAGSLLKSKDPQLYDNVLAQHESMVALERSRKVSEAQADAEPDANRTRNCPQCGVAFHPARANHRYCTDVCRKASFRSRAA